MDPDLPAPMERGRAATLDALAGALDALTVAREYGFAPESSVNAVVDRLAGLGHEQLLLTAGVLAQLAVDDLAHAADPQRAIEELRFLVAGGPAAQGHER